MDSIKRVILAGGGIAGLCTAIGLHRQGIQAEVYEQAPSLERVGAGLTLWANAIKALRGLGVAEAVLAHGARVQRGELRNQHGQAMAFTRTGELEQRFGEPTIGIHRADLHACLQAALPLEAIHLGEGVASYATDPAGVTVSFTSGRTARAELLVGADGIHSAVRAQAFPGVRLRYSGYIAWRGVLETAEAVTAGVSSEVWGCGQRFGFLRLNPRQVYWFATANTPPGLRQTPAERKADLLRRFADWAAPVPALVAGTAQDAILLNDIEDFPPLRQWSRGRVTLVGDAAHATTPNLGQGACQAIESSLALAVCLGQGERQGVPLEARLARYEALRRPRTTWINRQSWRFGWGAQLAHPWICRLRNLALRLVPEEALKQTMAQAAGYDIAAELDQTVWTL